MTSDLHIPRTCDILDRACDALASAYRLQDDATARQLERLVTNLPGARLCWQLGTLLLTSPSGHTYRVTRAGCDCPNGTRSHARACWHVAVFGLLEDMLETEAESADIAADYYAAKAQTELAGYRPDPRRAARDLGATLARARAALLSGDTGW